MSIERIELKNFRCFDHAFFEFDQNIVLIQGNNGTGKTSLLEALYYLSSLRSFRTHIPKELIAFDKDSFFINAQIDDHRLTIGSTGTKKLVKLDEKSVESYQELRTLLRIIIVAEYELDIVSGGPEKRRLFLDHALSLCNSDYLQLARRYKHALEQRNALFYRHTVSEQEFEIWTQSLWELSCAMVQARRTYLTDLQTIIAEKLPSALTGLDFKYHARYLVEKESFSDFLIKMAPVFAKERYYKRSLFGAHLDDIHITLHQKPVRLFSSRGQQKYIVALIKLAQAQHLASTVGPVVFLFDDFATDFDNHLLATVIEHARSTAQQLIFTSPIENGPEKRYFDLRNITYQVVTV